MALSRMYAQLWGLLFETELGPLPEWVHSPCCAEFVVSRERVRLRPLAFYASLLNWLGHTSQVGCSARINHRGQGGAVWSACEQGSWWLGLA